MFFQFQGCSSSDASQDWLKSKVSQYLDINVDFDVRSDLELSLRPFVWCHLRFVEVLAPSF